MLKAIILFFIFTIISCVPVNAARKIYISSDNISIHNDEELILNASPSGFIDKEKIYIKGAFYKDGSSNYFGYTKNNSSWIKNSVTTLEQRQVEIGNWDKLVSVKIDPLDTGFTGVGDYKCKLGFYYLTSSGNLSSINWSENSLDLRLDAVIPSTASENYSESEPYAVALDHQEPSNSISTQSNNSLSSTKTLTLSKMPTKSVKIASDSKSASEYASIKAITVPEEDEKRVAVLGVSDSDKIYLTYLLAGFVFLIIAGVVFARRFFIDK